MPSQKTKVWIFLLPCDPCDLRLNHFFSNFLTYKMALAPTMKSSKMTHVLNKYWIFFPLNGGSGVISSCLYTQSLCLEKGSWPVSQSWNIIHFHICMNPSGSWPWMSTKGDFWNWEVLTHCSLNTQTVTGPCSDAGEQRWSPGADSRGKRWGAGVSLRTSLYRLKRTICWSCVC